MVRPRTPSFTIPLSSELVNSLVKGEFELDCSSMILKRGVNDTLTTFSGSGYIKQVRGESFVFKLFVASWQGQFIDKGQPGQVVQEEKLYTLIAIDIWGRMWTAEGVYCNFDSFNNKVVIVYGSIFEITMFKDIVVVEKPFLRLRFYGDYHLPLPIPTKIKKTTSTRTLQSSGWLNRAKLRVNGCQLEIVQEDGYLMVDVSSKRTMPENLVERIVEAMEFIVGKPMPYFTVEKFNLSGNYYRIKETPERELTGMIEPPLHPHLSSSNSFWLLFEKYLKFIWASPDATFHPIARIFHSIILSSAASVYTEALVISIAVEDILKTHFVELGLPSSQFLTELQKVEDLLFRTKDSNAQTEQFTPEFIKRILRNLA